MNGQRVLQKWNAETHEAILIEVIDHLEVSTSDWKVIVEKLQDKGHTFTHSALIQHLQKLRRKEGGAAAATANGGDDGPVPETPAKRKRAPAGKKAGSAAAKKKGGKAAPKQEDDSEEDSKSSPTKKVKVEKEVENPLNDDEDDLPPFAEV